MRYLYVKSRSLSWGGENQGNQVWEKRDFEGGCSVHGAVTHMLALPRQHMRNRFAHPPLELQLNTAAPLQ